MLGKWLEAAPSVSVAALGFYVVHKLTQSREREKAVLDLYKTMGDQITAASKAAASAWKAKRGPERTRAVAEALWRIQQVGASGTRIRSLSKRKRWRRVAPLIYWWIAREINLTNAQIEFRRKLTSDEAFMDENRNADNVQAISVENAAGDYHAVLDEQLYAWLAS